MAAVAQENVRDNDLTSAVTVVCADMREIQPESVGAPVDIVVSNPPYRRGRSGRVNPDMQRALARHEIAITLPDVIRASRRLLKTGGRLIMIYTAIRSAELLCQMRAERIEPKRLRSIHSSERHDASLVLVEGIREGGPGLAIAPPLIDLRWRRFLHAGSAGHVPRLNATLTSSGNQAKKENS